MLLQKIFPHCAVLAAVATFSALKARVSKKYTVYLVSLISWSKLRNLYLREVSIYEHVLMLRANIF